MDDTLKTIAIHLTPTEAELAKNLLEREGIQAFVCEVASNSWLWHMANAFRGVKLLVAQSDSERAMEVLGTDFEVLPGPDDSQDDIDPIDAIARRASVAAFLGMALFPIVPTVYSIWLMAKYGLLSDETSGRTRLLVVAAIAFNGVAILIFSLFAIAIMF